MKKIIPMIAIVALLPLAACGQTETRADRAAAEEKAAEEAAELAAETIEMPPAIRDSRTYRCKDGSLIYVDFYADDKSVSLRSEKGGTPTRLEAEEAGKPFKAEGYTINGNGKSINVVMPGKGPQTCKA